MMTEQEKMLSGLPYDAFDEVLVQGRKRAQQLMHMYNHLSPEQTEERDKIIRKLLGKYKNNIIIEQSFHCDYGSNIEIGDNFYSNFNLTILDCAKVTIGDNCMFGPNASIFTAGHPVHHELRNTYVEYALPITIGNNCWIGGGTVINPGVTIGSNVVIGSGSVVTKDIPDNVIAAGSPAKVIRYITEEDKNFYCKNRPYPVK